jgi:catechol 2,3-dioxygenase-like lactoylglutathione lyase family enzyme
MQEQSRHPLKSPTTRGVHHLALCTDDMKATIDFCVDVLGMPLVHAMKVPPGLGTGPANRGNPPYEQVKRTAFVAAPIRGHQRASRRAVDWSR